MKIIHDLIDEIEQGCVWEPFDNFMFKESRPWVHGKSMIKRGLNKYKLKIKRTKILF